MTDAPRMTIQSRYFGVVRTVGDLTPCEVLP